MTRSSRLCFSLAFAAAVAQADRAPAQDPAASHARRPVMIQDARLSADSTLFPYEWPAFQELHGALLDLRPALETQALRELTAALPRLETLVGRLSADSLPPLLRPHRQETHGRIIAMQDALRQARELSGPALIAADSVAQAARAGAEVGGAVGPGVDVTNGGNGAAGSSGWPTEWPGDMPAADAATAGGDTTVLEPISGLPAGPLELYQDSWRDLYRHAETLLHRMREL